MRAGGAVALLFVLGCAAPHAARFDAASSPAPTDAPAITYAGVFVTGEMTGSELELEEQARAAGDAILVELVGVPGNGADYSISAPGWTLTLLGATASTATFGAIAPDASSAHFTVTTGDRANRTIVLADEISGAATFATAVTATGTGDCRASLLAPATDAVWLACFSMPGTRPGPGFQPASAAGPVISAFAPTASLAIDLPAESATAPFALTAVALAPR